MFNRFIKWVQGYFGMASEMEALRRQLQRERGKADAMRRHLLARKDEHDAAIEAMRSRLRRSQDRVESLCSAIEAAEASHYRGRELVALNRAAASAREEASRSGRRRRPGLVVLPMPPREEVAP